VPVLYALGAALGALAVAAGLATLTRAALILVYPLTILAALVLGAADLQMLLTGDTLTGSLPIGLPTIGLRLRLDSLSAFFGVVINGGVLAAAVYGLGLDRHKDLTQRVEPLFPIFAAAMNLVLLAEMPTVFCSPGS
jgi:hydrogenase-4 component B